MGLFNDNVNPNRNQWTYRYKGSELLAKATSLYDSYYKKESESRLRMSEYMKDMSISNADRRVEDTKREIVSYGTLKEQCLVFKHEFARNPDKEYDLGLGDVTFFELVDVNGS